MNKLFTMKKTQAKLGMGLKSMETKLGQKLLQKFQLDKDGVPKDRDKTPDNPLAKLFSIMKQEKQITDSIKREKEQSAKRVSEKSLNQPKNDIINENNLSHLKAIIK